MQNVSNVIVRRTKANFASGDDNTMFWWNALGPIMSKLLNCFCYSHKQQQNALEFVRDFIAPNLGSRPTEAGFPSSWKSFMTDDFTPIEFSWTWSDQNHSVNRRVRLSIEPIGPLAGSPSDPWNSFSTPKLLGRLSHTLRNLDLGWFYEIATLCEPSSQHAPDTPTGRSDPSTMFLAFEFGDSEPVVKAYLILSAKSSTSGQAEELVMDNVLSRFAQKQCWPELQDLAEILRDRGRSLQLRPFMIAVDCVSPPDARLKIYCRSPDTSLAAVEHTLSLFEDRSTISNGLREIRVLWHLLFALDDSETGSRQLPHLDMQTAGMLYYIEIRPRARKRTVKVYLPIKHYAKNDLQAAHGLTTFLQRRERGMEQVCDKYLQALGVMCSHRTLQSSLGLQTYVSCAIEDDRLSLTSYLSPEVYCPGRAEKQPE